MSPLWRKKRIEESPDKETIRAASEGNPCAVTKILMGMRPWLVAHVRMQAYPEQVEDFVQEVSVEIIRALRKASPDKLPDPFVPWARTIARRKVSDLRRRRDARPEMLVDADRLVNILDLRSAPADQVAVVLALDSLSAQHRELLIRRYVQEERLDDMADELGISRTTLVRRLERAESELRSRLGDIDE